MNGHDLMITIQTLLLIFGGLGVVVADISSINKIPIQNINTPKIKNFVTKDDLSAFKAEMLDAIKAMNAPAQNNNYHKRKPNYNNGGSQNNERS